MSASNYADWASWLNGKAKKLTWRLGRDWWVLAELAGLSGYATVQDEKFMDDVVSWVTEVHSYRSPFIGVSWKDALGAAMELVLDETTAQSRDRPLPAYPALDEWCADPLNWGLQGGSFDTHGTRLFVHFHGERVRTKKNKWASALALSPAEVKRRILSHKLQAAKAIAKRETKKVRAVISSDLDTYLKMLYFDGWLRHFFKGSKYSTLWMDAEARAQMWYELAVGGPSTDVDQAKFDHSIRLEDILNLIGKFERFLPPRYHPAREDLRRVLQEIIYALSGGFVHMDDGGMVPIRNGVLSGWLWTALLDTLLNLSEAFLAREVTLRRHGATAITTLVAQGDDLHARFLSWGAAIDFFHAYEFMGLPANAQKTIIDDRIAEMLRKFGDAHTQRVSGYAARAINGILFRNPINDPERPGTQRLSGIRDRWNALCGRLEERSVPAACVEDLSRGNELDPAYARLWLRSPSALGGGGILPTSDHLYLRTTTATRVFSGLSVTDAPGARAIQARAVHMGMVAPDRVLNNWAATVLRFPERDTNDHSEWEAAEFVLAFWPSRHTTSAPLPKAPAITPEQSKLLGVFPSDENCAAVGAPREKRLSLRWWIAYLNNALGQPAPRIWGMSPDFASIGLGLTATGLAGGFYYSAGRKSWEEWTYHLASAEVQLRQTAEDLRSKGIFVTA